MQRDGRNSIHFICHRHTRCVAGKILSFVYDCFPLFLFTSANAENNVFFSIPSLAIVSKLLRLGNILARFHSQFDDYLRSMVLRKKRSLFDEDYQDDADR